MEAPKILYLSYDGLTDPLGQSQILPYMEGLSKMGCVITIVTFEKRERFMVSGNELSASCRNFNITWVPLFYHKNPPIFSTIYDLWRMCVVAQRLVKAKKFSIVHCRSYLTSLIGVRLKKKFGLKFIFDMRGFWADERVEGKLWNLKNPVFSLVYSFFKRKERDFVSQADIIVSLTKNAKKEVESWGVPHAPIEVIPTCVDLDIFNRQIVSFDATNKMREKLGIDPHAFVLLYLGSWGTWYMVEEMLDFFLVVKRLQPNARFLIVSPDTPDLANYLLKKDVIHTSANRREIPVYISIANVAVFFIRPSYSKKASSATKMAEILAMDVPLVTNSGWGDVSETLSNHPEWLVSKFDASAYEFAIHSASNFSGQTRFIVSDNFSLSSGCLKYFELYNRALNS